MKAIRVKKTFGSPEVLQYETDVTIPKPSSTEVLVRVHAVGVNPVETYIRAGQYGRLPSLPYTPGTDSAGVIEEVGSEVKGFKKGNRVWTSKSTSGAYAEFATVPVSGVHPLPDRLSFIQGASLSIPYLTAYRGLITRANARPGETLLVHGASGGVGMATVQLAKAHGLSVIGTAGTEEGLKIVTKAGADHVFNHREPGYLDAIRELCPQGIDVVFENAAHVNLGEDLRLLAAGGRVAVVGSRGPIQVNPRDTMTKESSVLGVKLFGATEEELKEARSAILAGIYNGWLRPIIGKEFKLEKASEAHSDIIHGSGALGRMVLTVD